jgi:cell division protein FtsQ
LDHRGRELQQVMGQTRFWWRALDALTPEETAPEPGVYNPTGNSRNQTSPNTSQPRATANPFALRISIADRRPLTRQRARRGTSYLAAALFGAVLCTSAAAAVLMSDYLAPGKIKSMASEKVTGIMLGLGFGIDQVSLTGHHYTPDSDIFDALDLPSVRTFAEFDAAAALKRIERLAWVDTAQITREYPGVLKVQVRERRPAGIWQRADKDYLIDTTGRVLAHIAAPNGWQLPRVSGEGANSEALMLFTALGRYPAIEEQFDHAERIAERRWSVVVKNGSRLELGADREDEGFAHIAARSELRRVLNGPPFVVDVRTPGRIVLRPLQSGKTANAAPAPRETGAVQ